MATYLLDTTVIVDVLNGKRERNELLAGLVRQGNSLACCAINVAEVFAGMRPDEAAATDALLKRLDYYEVTWEIAKRAGELRYQQARRGHTRSLTDTIIASVAMSYGLTLMTDNVKDYSIGGLPIAGLQLYPLRP